VEFSRRVLGFSRTRRRRVCRGAGRLRSLLLGGRGRRRSRGAWERGGERRPIGHEDRVERKARVRGRGNAQDRLERARLEREQIVVRAAELAPGHRVRGALGRERVLGRGGGLAGGGLELFGQSLERRCGRRQGRGPSPARPHAGARRRRPRSQRARRRGRRRGRASPCAASATRGPQPAAASAPRAAPPPPRRRRPRARRRRRRGGSAGWGAPAPTGPFRWPRRSWRSQASVGGRARAAQGAREQRRTCGRSNAAAE
jgi:hypothetical protein